MEKSKISLYSPEVYRKCLARIAKLTPESKPKWGKMSVAQMLAHCAEIQDVSNGKLLENTRFIARLFKGMIRKMVLSNKPYPKSMKTHPQYEQTSSRDFHAEKQHLLKALEGFVNADMEKVAEVEHTFLGKMTLEEKGWANYKHLDHHLIQFGV